eukprot:471683_1
MNLVVNATKRFLRYAKKLNRNQTTWLPYRNMCFSPSKSVKMLYFNTARYSSATTNNKYSKEENKTKSKRAKRKIQQVYQMALAGCGVLMSYGTYRYNKVYRKKGILEEQKLLKNVVVSHFKNPPKPLTNTQYPYLQRSDDNHMKSVLKEILTPNHFARLWVVYGTKNIGKTSMISQIVEEIYSSESPPPPIIYCSLETGTRGIVNAFNFKISQENQFEKSMHAIYHDLLQNKQNKSAVRNVVPVLILDEVHVHTWSDSELKTFIGVLKGCYDKALLKIIVVTSSRNTKNRIVGHPKLNGRVLVLKLAHRQLAFNSEELLQFIKMYISDESLSISSIGEEGYESDVLPHFEKFAQIIQEISGGHIGTVALITECWQQWYKENDLKNAMLTTLYSNAFRNKLQNAITRLKKNGLSKDDLMKLINTGSNLPNTLEPFSDVAKILESYQIIKIRDEEDKNGQIVIKCKWRIKAFELMFENKKILHRMRLEVY